LREVKSLARPATLEVAETRIRVGFAKPLAADCLPAVAALKFWNINRSGAYGSGHYRWDGKPGNHVVEPEQLSVSADRRSLDLVVPVICRSDLMVLSLQMMNKTSGRADVIEIYANPAHLKEAGSRELQAVRSREKGQAKTVAGDARRGAEVFTRYACVGCHSTEGEKLTGPPLNGIATRHATDLDAYLRESILDPGKVVTDGYEAAMPSFAGVIPAQELEDLITYLTGLR
jgi:cytochrome c2